MAFNRPVRLDWGGRRIGCAREPSPGRAAGAVARGGTKAFWSEVAGEGTPLIEPIPGTGRMRLTFLWQAERGEGDSNVAVFAPFNEEDPLATRRMSRLAESDVWFRTYTLDQEARFTYSLAFPAGRAPHPEVIRRQTVEGLAFELFADPKCRRSIAGVFFDESRPYSYAQGPAALPEPWLQPRDTVRRGRTITRSFISTILGNEREVAVYLPPGHPEGGAYPFVVLFDGRSYLRTAEATQLDNLIADGAIPPMVAVFVGRIDREHRNRELPPNPAFARFVVEELVPSLRREYRLSTSPHQAVIGGASYGGLAAASIARGHPEVFGNVFCQSGSFWWHPGFEPKVDDAFRQQVGFLPRSFATGPHLPLRFYLEVGLWEGSNMVLSTRFFRDLLQARGNDVEYREFVGGHDYASWRSGFPRALIYLLGRKPALSRVGQARPLDQDGSPQPRRPAATRPSSEASQRGHGGERHTCNAMARL
jgi:enterochelin esterase-like enzyme